MNLVRIAKGRWEVLAEVESGGNCPVLDLLSKFGVLREPQVFLNRFLRVYLPLEGPPVSSLPRCRPLADGIFELRSWPGGQESVVLFFADEDQRIVCASTLGSKPRYFAAKSARGLQISEEAP
ncbi:MAG TPA: hypothetical protein VGQ28_01865 [Thermoanaerobaculia bacterium]|jgi:hypothetical protein|nr:hypothetical protein [Thermoanaerobaculia bacterium]